MQHKECLSFEIDSIVIESQPYISPTAFSLLFRMSYNESLGIYKAGNRELQKNCNISKNTVTKALDELNKLGLVDVNRRARKVSTYKINYEELREFVEDSKLLDCKTIVPVERTRIEPRIKKFVFERDAYRCINCGTHKSLSIDHTVPVSKGGGNEIRNLQTLCKSCNSSKGSKDMLEWLETQ